MSWELCTNSVGCSTTSINQNCIYWVCHIHQVHLAACQLQQDLKTKFQWTSCKSRTLRGHLDYQGHKLTAKQNSSLAYNINFRTREKKIENSLWDVLKHGMWAEYHLLRKSVCSTVMQINEKIFVFQNL